VEFIWLQLFKGGIYLASAFKGEYLFGSTFLKVD
jgi:hypothetical protein